MVALEAAAGGQTCRASLGLGLQALGFAFRGTQGVEFRVQGFGISVQGSLNPKPQGFGIRFLGFGLGFCRINSQGPKHKMPPCHTSPPSLHLSFGPGVGTGGPCRAVETPTKFLMEA